MYIPLVRRGIQLSSVGFLFCCVFFNFFYSSPFPTSFFRGLKILGLYSFLIQEMFSEHLLCVRHYADNLGSTKGKFAVSQGTK